MPLLRLTDHAACPAQDAPEYLRRYLLEHADGDHAVLALRPALSFAALPDLTLVRDCVVDLHLAADGSSGAPVEVTWRVAGDDDTMLFDGTLRVDDASDELLCSVVVEGRYQPPPPVNVRGLELLMGRRIAESIGRELLVRVTHYLAASSRSAQSARLNRRTA